MGRIFVLAYTVCFAHGQRVRDSDALETLAVLLLRPNPTLSLNSPGVAASTIAINPILHKDDVNLVDSSISGDQNLLKSRTLEISMGPPLPQSQLGFALSTRGKPVVIELFLDFICPFSCKMFKTIQDSVLPKFGNSITFVVHQVIQPWHAHGTWVHEVCLGIAAEFPERYPAFVRKVIEAYEGGAFQDESTWAQSRSQVYGDLFRIAEEVGGIDIAKLGSMLTLTAAGNAGNQITQSVKWACKYHRVRGVHVTPTVFLNGLEAGSVSSGWTAEEWDKFLTNM